MSALGLLVIAVPSLIIALITRLDSAGPVFFRQERSGKDKKPFYIYKFRSMPLSVRCDVPSIQLKGIKITKWQKFLRKSSLDELPQLINIFVGDMSFVGPRPVICEEQDLIQERDKYGANNVLPGLTGWAQINGRDELDFETKARLDGDYVKHLSFSFDLRCLFATVLYVVRQEGIII